jgi:hypothetical protein
LFRNLVNRKKSKGVAIPINTAKKPLKDKLGDEAIDALIDLINQSQLEQQTNIAEFVEEKFERRLSQEMSTVKVEITNLYKTLTTHIEKTRSELLKWMFIFWIGQVGVILSVLFVFFL